MKGFHPVILLAVPSLLVGCSRASSLIVHNESPKLITVQVEWEEASFRRGQSGRLERKLYVLPPHAQEEQFVWSNPPNSFRVIVEDLHKTHTRVFPRVSYPRSMTTDSFFGTKAHLRISPGSWILAGPTRLDTFKEIAPVLCAGVLCLGAPFALASLAFFRKSKRARSSHGLIQQ